MATSTIKLYKNTQLYPSKNFAIDSIADYLLPKLNKTLSEFQYIRHSLATTIKIDYSQTYLDLKDTSIYWDYCSIQNSTDSKPVYYFVVNARWKAQSTLELELKMDTINTFALGTDYSLGGRTLIKREHRDRLKIIDGDLYRNIDYVSEQISLPKYKQSNEYEIQHPDGDLNQNFYLIYKNQNTPDETDLDNPVDCYLTSDNSIHIYTNDGTSVVNAIQFRIEYREMMWQRLRYSLVYSLNVGGSFYGDGDTANRITLDSGEYACFQYNGLSGKVDVYLYRNGAYTFQASYSYISFEDCTILNGEYLYMAGDQMWWSATGTSYDLKNAGTQYLIDAFDKVQRNDSKLIKIIETPYIPIALSDGIIPAGWEYDSLSKMIKLTSLFSTFENEIPFGYYVTESSGEEFRENIIVSNSGNLGTEVLMTKYYTIPDNCSVTDVFITPTTLNGTGTIVSTSTSGNMLIINYYLYNSVNPNTNIARGYITIVYETTTTTKIFHEIDVKTEYGDIRWNKLLKVEENFTPSVEASKDMKYESKLYHSDFFNPKFVYDSFSFTFDLEKVNKDRLQEIYNLTTSLVFKATSTINSRFLFAFPQYDCGNMQKEDYNYVCNASRNNEMTLFNTPYINYIRGGYNYDVKNKERQNFLGAIGLGLSGLGTIASVATGGLLTPVMATGFGTSLANLIGGTIGREQTMEKNLKQLELQATSVRGSDDVDLYNYYAHNRAKLVHYGVDDYSKGQLYNLFFYYGYYANYYGIPTLNTRQKFNYIEADIDFINTSGKISGEMKDDIIARYATGLTFIHVYLKSGVKKWDVEQVYENWETSLTA